LVFVKVSVVCLAQLFGAKALEISVGALEPLGAVYLGFPTQKRFGFGDIGLALFRVIYG